MAAEKLIKGDNPIRRLWPILWVRLARQVGITTCRKQERQNQMPISERHDYCPVPAGGTAIISVRNTTMAAVMPKTNCEAMNQGQSTFSCKSGFTRPMSP